MFDDSDDDVGGVIDDTDDDANDAHAENVKTVDNDFCNN